MRSRRIRSRFSRPLPKPELVIQAAAPAPAVLPEALEPSRAREREAYVASEEDNATVIRVVEELLASMEVEYEVEFEHTDFQRVFLKVEDRQAGSLIGKRGSGLEALETLIGRMASHQVGRAVPVQVDVNEYRVRYEDELRADARAMAERVLRSGREERFAPLVARDRRVVHLAVQEFNGLQTYSVGHGGAKAIVIRCVEQKND